MTKMVKEHNATTGEIIEREINAEEIAELNENLARVQFEAETEATTSAAKAAILNRLGLTEDEARLLLS